MKKAKIIISSLLALSIILSASAAAAGISFKGKAAPPSETFNIVVDKQAAPAIVAKENATAAEVYLPASYSYRVPDDNTATSHEDGSFGTKSVT